MTSLELQKALPGRLATLCPSSNGSQTCFSVELPNSTTEIHETTYIPHPAFHFEQKPACWGKLETEKTYQSYVSLSSPVLIQISHAEGDSFS